jgi:hypothetical protein
MGDVLNKKLRVRIEYSKNSREMKINMEGAEGDYFANLDEVSINPKVVDVNNFEIRKSGVKMDVDAPVICDPDNKDSIESFLVGIKFEGKDKEKVVQHVEERVKSFGPEWEKAVRKRRERIKERISK